MSRPQRLLKMTWRRLLAAVPVVIGVSLAVFALAALSPMDPLEAYLGASYQTATQGQLDSLRQSLNLDAPWYMAWWYWVQSLFHGDWGMSRSESLPVSQVILMRAPWTILLGGVALLVSFTLAGIGAAVTAIAPRGIIDRTLVNLSQLIEGTPVYIVAVGAIAIFAVRFQVLPVGGNAPIGQTPTLGSVAIHLIMPAIVLGIAQTPWLHLQLREGLRRAMAEPNIQGARMRGIPESQVIVNHALPYAALPVVGLLASRIPELITGALLVETVFAWPGLASEVVSAAVQLDFPLLAAITLVTTLLTLFGTWLSDALLISLDPRVNIDG
ncbi:ABC transporter permease [Stomatohabitans albus]|uniref:ABC transporter permease n=1 Tax=Stomatohabitans albus TaxID=3110766 RepID=UPI00300C6058